MGRKFWKFRNAAEPGVGELLISGPIAGDGGWFEDLNTPKQFKAEPAKLSTPCSGATRPTSS